MVALKDLLVREGEIQGAKVQLATQMEELDDSLARIRICIAEVRNVNQNAGTYSLPSETISAIFEAGRSAVVTPRNAWGSGTEVQLPFPMLVSSVSRRWRNIALQTPQLWTSIAVDIRQSTDNLLDLYLDRSKAGLLDIVFMRAPSGRELYVANFYRQMGRLIPHVTRWRKLDIQLIYVTSSATAFSLLTHLHSPSLETLVLECSDELDGGTAAVDIFSAGAPLLSSLALSGASLRPPLGKITSFQLGGNFSYDGLSKLMGSMPALTHLSMSSGIIADSEDQLPIHLPGVLTLEVRMQYDSVDDLQYLDLPAVETLTIHALTHHAIYGFTKHPHNYPLLRSLTIVSVQHSDRVAPTSTTLEFISLFPNATDVIFEGANPSPILHALYECDSSDMSLWPCLRTISITPPTSHIDPLSKQQICYYIGKVIKNRHRLGHPILCTKLSSRILKHGNLRQQQKLRKQVSVVECESSDEEWPSWGN